MIWYIARKEKRMDKKIYVASNATVMGNVVMEENVNIWYCAVVRGDSGTITLGEGTNVQDNAVIHEQTTLGKYCTVGHGAIVHGATLGDECLVGMGAIILNGAKLGKGCLVGAGALVTGKMDTPAGSVLLGSPAKITKTLTAEEMAANRHNADHYIELAKKYLPER